MKSTTLTLLISLLISLSLNAAPTYYSQSVVEELSQGRQENEQLKGYLQHVASKNFRPLGYRKMAKKALFGTIHLQRDSQGYYIRGVYCDFMVRNHIGPQKLPLNREMNTEHTWPQSKGAKRRPARGDLHHLFPTNSLANSARGNHPFGEVRGKDAISGCDLSQRGKIIDPETGAPTRVYGFQPNPEHRGNVARAMFYVSVKYGYDIPKLEEYYLRKWNREDPVDEQEMKRNNAIEKAQGNRNPFIDFPELADRIKNL